MGNQQLINESWKILAFIDHGHPKTYFWLKPETKKINKQIKYFFKRLKIVASLDDKLFYFSCLFLDPNIFIPIWILIQNYSDLSLFE